jgi:ribosomal protein S18 acetylase RimI-like enzyme
LQWLRLLPSWGFGPQASACGSGFGVATLDAGSCCGVPMEENPVDPMPLEIRLAKSSDYKRLEQLFIDSFEPISLYRKVEERFGPFNGQGWREQWRLRLRKVFDREIILVGEIEGEIVAAACGICTPETRLAFLNLLAVDQRFQRRGLGREMLQTMMEYMKEQGAEHMHLDCLADNDSANDLYRAEGFQEMGRSIYWYGKIP